MREQKCLFNLSYHVNERLARLKGLAGKVVYYRAAKIGKCFARANVHTLLHARPPYNNRYMLARVVGTGIGRIAGNGLPASTLVEVLILMILSGVVFLSIMDGFGLLNRFLDRTSQRISEQTEQYAGYFRTVDLAGDSDSLISEGERTLALYRKGGIHARLSLADSALIVRQDERSDTLLRNVVRLRTVPEPVPGARIDTMIVELRSEQDSVLSIGFLPRRPPDPLLEKLSEQEAKYRYEENENESNEESK